MASSRTPSSRTPNSRTGPPWAGGPATAATGWFPVARSSEVGTTPLQVGAGGQAYVVLRTRPGAEVTALSARCPHRLVPLTTATVVDGRVQCSYHGWQFNAEGRCVEIPSLGPVGTPPPRADLSAPWAVEERDGWVWLAPDPTPTTRPPRTNGTAPSPEPVPDLPPPDGPVLDNLHPVLEHAWHPVALATELREGGYLQTRLLGRTWTVHRRAGGALDADPPAWAVVERLGVVWIAPAEPRDELLAVPETADPRAVSGWLPPARSPASAGALADAFLDTSRRPVRPTPEVPEPAAPVLTYERGGFSGVQEERTDRRRVTAVHRAPFQLVRREEDLRTGLVTTVVRLLQPEDADSTRVHTCVLVQQTRGTASPDALAAALTAARAAAAAVLDEDLALLARVGSTGLPLLPRDELHVRADLLGVALRRVLADFTADCPAVDQADLLQRRASA
ncbi:Rieske 2Fe-2S domain-containing protein [Modestobacter sp. VKM Ac-2984]|uniref:Rieske 2Fe-2S domain-containing protein n=1 Tax=Modestobacter sp. VKM Ac-2984 TaxID=3004138 RepID=UPI0022AAD653|nr:Rieske 2Fe-2S domain-containing protein [Modestobacter sp. VKM Ac-2984]MCZ2817140.1 Rieske 2Fe-2S domain-containing protein [Modestobacter sp. VKM Ac-2984]